MSMSACEAIIQDAEKMLAEGDARGSVLSSLSVRYPRADYRLSPVEALVMRCKEDPKQDAAKLERVLNPIRPNVLGLAQTLAAIGASDTPSTREGLLEAPWAVLRALWRRTYSAEPKEDTPQVRQRIVSEWNLADPKTSWRLSWRADPDGASLADRHYNRQKVGAKNFGPPGRTLALMTLDERALWVSSWQYGTYTDHDFGGFDASGGFGFTAPWVNSTFRNEGAVGEDGQKILSSRLIQEAVCVTRWWWDHHREDDIPASGFVTFVDAGAVKGKKTPGMTYHHAGWKNAGTTGSGLVALRLSKERLLDTSPPLAPAGCFDVDALCARIKRERAKLSMVWFSEPNLTSADRAKIRDLDERARRALAKHGVESSPLAEP